MKTKEDKISRCIACPVAHKFISEYLLFTKASDNLKHTENKSKSMRVLRKQIDNVSEPLKIDGTYSERYQFLKNISYSNKSICEKYSGLTEICECVSTLNLIISPIYSLFRESEYPSEEVLDLSHRGIKTINAISEFLIENNIKTPVLTPEEKSWSTDYRITLGYTLPEDEYEDEPTEECTKKAQDTYDKFKKILLDYCQSTNSVTYKYCNPFFNEDKTLGNCKSNSIELLQQKNNELGMRLFKLKDEYRKIVYVYLEKAPKKFRDILARIIKYQDLSYTDVAELWNDKKRYASNIKALLTNESNQLNEDDYKMLQKILLVSSDMLICGSGTIYGNWNNVLRKQDDKNEQNMLLDFYGERLYKDTKSKIRKDIIDIINSDDFEEIRKSSEFFCEEEVCLYTVEDDYSQELCYDLGSMYNSLLNPEEFEVLLSTLEKLQTTE